MKIKILIFGLTLLAGLSVSLIAQENGASPPPQPKEKKPPAPALVNIESPAGGTVNERIIKVAGRVENTEEESLTLVVNGVPMRIRIEGGRFESKRVLSPGWNVVCAVLDENARGASDSVRFFARVPSRDVKVTLTWDTDKTDVDLHVIEPSGEKCWYQDKTTMSGGNLDLDVTDGFGPETYTLACAETGRYQVWAVYYSAGEKAQTVCRLDVVLHEGTSRERGITKSFILTHSKQKVFVTDFFAGEEKEPRE